MVCYDASVLIDYLAGDEDVLAFVERRADANPVTVPLVLYEIYEGEIFRPGQGDFDALESRLDWLHVVDSTRRFARQAAEVQAALESEGAYLAPRDAYVAGAARALNEPLATRDGDFDEDAVRAHVDVVVV